MRGPFLWSATKTPTAPTRQRRMGRRSLREERSTSDGITRSARTEGFLHYRELGNGFRADMFLPQSDYGSRGYAAWKFFPGIGDLRPTTGLLFVRREARRYFSLTGTFRGVYFQGKRKPRRRRRAESFPRAASGRGLREDESCFFLFSGSVAAHLPSGDRRNVGEDSTSRTAASATESVSRRDYGQADGSPRGRVPSATPDPRRRERRTRGPALTRRGSKGQGPYTFSARALLRLIGSGSNGARVPALYRFAVDPAGRLVQRVGPVPYKLNGRRSFSLVSAPPRAPRQRHLRAVGKAAFPEGFLRFPELTEPGTWT